MSSILLLGLLLVLWLWSCNDSPPTKNKMPSRKSPAANNRHLFGNAHGPGKGDKSRVTNTAAYVANFPEGMGNRPGRMFRVYGVRAVPRKALGGLIIH